MPSDDKPRASRPNWNEIVAPQLHQVSDRVDADIRWLVFRDLPRIGRVMHVRIHAQNGVWLQLSSAQDSDRPSSVMASPCPGNCVCPEQSHRKPELLFCGGKLLEPRLSCRHDRGGQANQRQIEGKIVSTVPRILLIIRVGRNTIHRSWIWTTHGFADVAISTFDDTDCANDGVRFLHRFPGGKLPGVMDFLRTHPAVIEQYDYFWLLDDDLVLPFDTLRRISALLARFPFDLSAPGLSYESFFSWPLTMANDRFLFRCTDFVEVMAPIMSRAFLQAAMLAFADNFSCWGHEWLSLTRRQSSTRDHSAVAVCSGTVRPARSALWRNWRSSLRSTGSTGINRSATSSG